jgi:hypothetical protein
MTRIRRIIADKAKKDQRRIRSIRVIRVLLPRTPMKSSFSPSRGRLVSLCLISRLDPLRRLYVFFFVFLWSKGLILGGASAILSQV